MLDQLSRHWWALAIRGVLAVVLGLIAILAPLSTFAALIMLFGAYVLLDGIFTCVAAARTPTSSERWWMMLIEGVLGVFLGIFLLVVPLSAAVALVWIVAAWAVITGFIEIAAAIELRKSIEGEWILGVAGVVSVLLGILLFMVPAAAMVLLSWLIGGYALVFGILQLSLAMRLRSHAHGYPPGGLHAPPV